MRAITGAVVSSKPCSLAKAFRILNGFYNSAASDLPFAGCATYLLTAVDATKDHKLFRRELRANQKQEAHDYEGEVKHQGRESKGDMAVPTGGSHGDSAAEVELDVAADEKKRKKNKNKEDRQEGRAVAGFESHIPSSPETTGEKRKKQKHSIKENIVDVKQEPDLVAEEELVREKKSKKKKKVPIKVKEEARDVDEVGGKIAKDGGLEHTVVGEEKKSKKKKHEEEVNSKDVKQEEKMVSNGDLSSEKKRKKKRGRGENADDALQQVEHTKKKQRK